MCYAPLKPCCFGDLYPDVKLRAARRHRHVLASMKVVPGPAYDASRLLPESRTDFRTFSSMAVQIAVLISLRRCASCTVVPSRLCFPRIPLSHSKLCHKLAQRPTGASLCLEGEESPRVVRSKGSPTFLGNFTVFPSTRRTLRARSGGDT